jgi:hypothetical protein
VGIPIRDPEEVNIQTGLDEVIECEEPLENRKKWKRIFMVMEQKLELLSFEVWRSGQAQCCR